MHKIIATLILIVPALALVLPTQSQITIDGIDYFAVSPTETIEPQFLDNFRATTEITYSGLIEVKTYGIGQSLGTIYNTAFYRFDNTSGNDPNPTRDNSFYQLKFDTESIDNCSSSNNAFRLIVFDIDANRPVVDPIQDIPAYRADHTYRFIIDTENTNPTTLHFGVADCGYSDNTGAFNITIRQLSAVPEPGSGTALALGVAVL